MFDWARFSHNGYEVSSAGDSRFSALYARLSDGRTIEEAYQLDVKGYRTKGNSWQIGKGKPPLRRINTWESYLSLWRQWAKENPLLMADLGARAHYGILTDRFATTGISQARALAQLLNEAREPSGSGLIPGAGTPPGERACAGIAPEGPSVAQAQDRR